MKLAPETLETMMREFPTSDVARGKRGVVLAMHTRMNAAISMKPYGKPVDRFMWTCRDCGCDGHAATWTERNESISTHQASARHILNVRAQILFGKG